VVTRSAEHHRQRRRHRGGGGLGDALAVRLERREQRLDVRHGHRDGPDGLADLVEADRVGGAGEQRAQHRFQGGTDRHGHDS
jgi:hypothetical protein